MALKGEQATGAKLSEAQVRDIVRRRLAGETTKDLAAEFNVDRTTIQRIMRGQNWRDVIGRISDKPPPQDLRLSWVTRKERHGPTGLAVHGWASETSKS